MADRNKTEFFPEDLVFAKMKSYPPWPALVIGPDEATSSTSQRNKITVQFLGTNEIGYIRKQDLFDYAEFRDKFGIPKKIKGFCDGLNQIAALYEERNAELQESEVVMHNFNATVSPELTSLEDIPLAKFGVKSASHEKSSFSVKMEPRSPDPKLDKECKVWLLQTKIESIDYSERSTVVKSPAASYTVQPKLIVPSSVPTVGVTESEQSAGQKIVRKRRKLSLNDSDAWSPSSSSILSEKRVPKKKKFDENFVVGSVERRRRKTANIPSSLGEHDQSLHSHGLGVRRRNQRKKIHGSSVPESINIFEGTTTPQSSIDESTVSEPVEKELTDKRSGREAEFAEHYETDIQNDKKDVEKASDSDSIERATKDAPVRIKFRKMAKRKSRSELKQPLQQTPSQQKHHRNVALSAKPLFLKRNKPGRKIALEEVEDLSEAPKAEESGESLNGEEASLDFKVSLSGLVKPPDTSSLLNRRLNNLRAKYAKKSKRVFVTAYGLWCEKESEVLAIEKPEINNFREINNILREKWRQVPEDEKERLRAQARKERQKRLQAVNKSSGQDVAEQSDASQSGSDEESSQENASSMSESSEPSPRSQAPKEAMKKSPVVSRRTPIQTASGGRGRSKTAGRGVRPSAEPHAVVLSRRGPIGPVEARCRWWMYQSASTTLQQRRPARENSPPRPLYRSDSVDGAAFFRLMSKSFQQMSERLERTNEVGSSASKSVMLDCLMDGFFVSMVHLLNMLKYAPTLKNCHPEEGIDMLLEKTAFLTPL